MLTVMMECQDQEPELAQTLAGLVSGAVEGLVSDVVVLDRGSKDGTLRVAEAAGCRFYMHWDMRDIVRSARGEWLLLVEPGARLQHGWIDELSEYIAFNKGPACFSPARAHRRPFYLRIARRLLPPLETGFLLPKRQALALAKSDMDLVGLTRGLKANQLSSEMIPSWVARNNRVLA
ncbi:hypothetical protein M8R20_03770 [Pseudomonas sp. R2.Fl]|nr:hypothetical protein [Pseudomonas sp. R2.Fl]